MKNNSMELEESSKPKVCPKCKSENIVDIVYGYPSREAREKAAKGEIELGGCCVYNGMPKYYCKDCGYEFGERRLRLPSFNKGGLE